MRRCVRMGPSRAWTWIPGMYGTSVLARNTGTHRDGCSVPVSPTTPACPRIVITSYSIHYTKLYEHPYVGSTFQPFADEVAAKTNGAISVKLYNGGELGAGPVEQYGRVVDGVAELAISLPGYTASNFSYNFV